MPVAGVDEVVLLDAAAAAEIRSEHPLGRSSSATPEEDGATSGEYLNALRTPGRDIDAVVDGVDHLFWWEIGILMRANGIAIPNDLLAQYPGRASQVFRCTGPAGCWVPSSLPTPCGRKRLRRYSP